MIAAIINTITLAVWAIVCILMAKSQTKILKKQFEINDYLETIECEQRLIRDLFYNFFSRIESTWEQETQKPESSVTSTVSENDPSHKDEAQADLTIEFCNNRWEAYKEDIMELQELVIGNKCITDIKQVNLAISLFLEYPDKWDAKTLLYYARPIVYEDYMDDDDFRDFKDCGLDLERELVEVTKSRIAHVLINKLRNHEVTAKMFFTACALKYDKLKTKE